MSQSNWLASGHVDASLFSTRFVSVSERNLIERLDHFKNHFRFISRSKLGLALVITRKVKELGLPIDIIDLITLKRGQVSGLSANTINKILREHGVTCPIGTESSRTSRNTVGAAKSYVEFLNNLHKGGAVDLEKVELWWVNRIVEFFNSQPFWLNYDSGRTLGSMVQDLLDQAVKRQRESPGTTYIGAVLQHLVGAKLSLVLHETTIEHHGFSVADAVSARSGDFVIDDAVIHCTTALTEALLSKCQDNLQAGMRPIILTVGRGVEATEVLAENKGIAGRVEIMDAVQFLATNLYELSLFKTSERRITIDKLVEKYNEIIDSRESDPSLRIAVD